jgi:hypothetical protein
VKSKKNILKVAKLFPFKFKFSANVGIRFLYTVPETGSATLVSRIRIRSVYRISADPEQTKQRLTNLRFHKLVQLQHEVVGELQQPGPQLLGLLRAQCRHWTVEALYAVEDGGPDGPGLQHLDCHVVGLQYRRRVDRGRWQRDQLQLQLDLACLAGCHRPAEGGAVGGGLRGLLLDGLEQLGLGVRPAFGQLHPDGLFRDAAKKMTVVIDWG